MGTKQASRLQKMEPSVYHKANNKYLLQKQMTHRAGINAKHQAVSRRALGANNYECDVNALIDDNFIRKL